VDIEINVAITATLRKKDILDSGFRAAEETTSGEGTGCEAFLASVRTMAIRRL
jgi:hypothetical protein